MSRFLRLTFALLFTLAFAIQPAFAQNEETEGEGAENTEQEESSAAAGSPGEKPVGLRITGLPLPSYNDDIGFTYGLRVIGTYYENNYDPYRWQVWGQYLASTKGFEDHAANLDALDFLGSGLRLQIRAGFERTLNAQYYGFGNFQDIQQIERISTGEVPVGENIPATRTILRGDQLAERSDFIDSKFGDEFNLNENVLTGGLTSSAINPGTRILRERQNKYFFYDRIRPYAQASTQSFLGETNFILFAGLRAQRYKIQSYFEDRDDGEAEANSRTLLDIEQPLGYDAVEENDRRYVNTVRAAIAYDSRPRVRELNPNSGIFADLHYEAAGKWSGSHYEFQRATLTWRQYIDVAPGFFNDFGHEFVFAYRLLGQETFGDVPFFEKGRIYTMNEASEGLGGSGGLRGYPSNQFVDTVMTMGNFEGRYTFARTGFLGGMDFQGLYFYDIGRVAPGWQEWQPKGLHKAWGPGISMVWQRNTIVTIFLGRSEFQSFTAFRLSHMF
ncbi:MAG: hypothetical protein NXI24_15575 [bacterium]|nr:hypothetical protein [bacterium]